MYFQKYPLQPTCCLCTFTQQQEKFTEYIYLETIPISCQNILGLFLTHPWPSSVINTVLNVSINGNYLNPPTQSCADVIQGYFFIFTGCEDFKRRVQNWRGFCLRIKMLKVNHLILGLEGETKGITQILNTRGVKKCQNWTFKVNFLCQKSSKSFQFFFH